MLNTLIYYLSLSTDTCPKRFHLLVISPCSPLECVVCVFLCRLRPCIRLPSLCLTMFKSVRRAFRGENGHGAEKKPTGNSPAAANNTVSNKTWQLSKVRLWEQPTNQPELGPTQVITLVSRETAQLQRKAGRSTCNDAN